MYNGIGLTTPRGSGTNGHVQNNLSTVHYKNKPKNNNQREKKDLSKIKTPNVDLLIHEEKKKIEIELYKLKSELIKEGKLTPEEIDQQISDQRKERMKLVENKHNKQQVSTNQNNLEETNERNEKFKKALYLDREFEKRGIKTNKDAELSAFDSKRNELKRKEKSLSLEKKHKKKKRKHRDDSDSLSSSSSDSDQSDQ